MHPGQLEQLEDRLGDRYYVLRFFAVLLLGAAGALLLTWFMHQLITSTQQRLDESGRAHMLDFVRLKREESSQQKQRKPPRPTQADAPPAPASPQQGADTDTIVAVSSYVAPESFSADVSISGLGISGSDGEYLPIVKVAPIYPRNAAVRQIEGECIVMYTVTANGSTRDVQVLEDQCSNRVFYRPSIEAAKKFKYKPRVIDGEAIEVHGVTNRFIYELEE